MLMIFMVVFFSCDPETLVINTVHEDGSVTRKVVMKSGSRDFDPEQFKVPIDSTWQSGITMETGERGDTTWILTAEKHFAGVEEINEGYRKDSGVNRDLKRWADFSRRFRWFTTTFSFSETVGSILPVSCPVSEFLNEAQLNFFYLPDKAKQSLKTGSDSTRYRELEEQTDSIGEIWMWTSFVRQWTEIFYNMYGADPDLEISREEMRSKEGQFVSKLIGNGEDESNGEGDNEMAWLFTSVLGGEFYREFRSEIDSAASVLEDMTDPFFSAGKYDMEIRMPGKIIGSNGYADTNPDPGESKYILWTVTGEYFFTEPYEMRVTSQVSNYWAWIVTAVFVLFVITGLVLRSRRKAGGH
jgi:hypothetical protein